MAFPAVTYTNGNDALTALENKATALGMTSAVLDQPAFVAAFLANLLTENIQPILPTAKYVSNATVGATTLIAGDATGAKFVCLGLTAIGAATATTRTATLMFGDIPGCQIGDSYMLLITNTSGGTTTIGAGAGVTITGTATLATNTVRLFNVRFTSATAATFQSVAVGTIS